MSSKDSKYVFCPGLFAVFVWEFICILVLIGNIKKANKNNTTIALIYINKKIKKKNSNSKSIKSRILKKILKTKLIKIKVFDTLGPESIKQNKNDQIGKEKTILKSKRVKNEKKVIYTYETSYSKG